MIRDLETIKMNMDENLKAFKEFQESQLRAYEELIAMSDIDEIDDQIQSFEEEFKFTTTLDEIVYNEKTYFKNLMDLAWNSKYKEGAING